MNESETRGLYQAYTSVYDDSQREEFYEKSSEIYEDDIAEVAAEYFYSYGLNEDGVNIFIEEVGLTNFVNFVYSLSENLVVLSEAKTKRKYRGPSYDEVKAKIDAKEVAKKKAREEAKKAKETPRREPERKAEKEQPKKKPVRDAIARTILSGMERHRKAMGLAKETGKTIGKAASVAHEAGRRAGEHVKKHGLRSLANEDTTYEDLLEFCLIEELFDTIEESEYFVEELIHNDLVEQFVVDTLEYYGYDESEIALYEGRGKAVVSGLIDLAKQFRQGNLLTRKGTAQNFRDGRTPFVGTDPITPTRRLPAASPQKPRTSPGQLELNFNPKPSKPSVKPSAEFRQGNLLTRKGTAQNFRDGRTPFVGTDPITPTRRLPAASPQKPRTSPGQLEIPKPSGGSRQPSKPPSSPRSSSKGMPFRATGPGGDARTQRLSQQAAPSSSARSAVSGLRSSDARKGARGTTAAAIGAIGAGTAAATATRKNNTTAKSQPAQTDVYNTMDPSGKVRSRKKVGPRLVGDTFEDAFREARKSGKSKFKYGKGEFTTQLASEQTDLFDTILEYLVAEGYADTNEAAITIMANMSEEWRESIAEESYSDNDYRAGGGDEKRLRTNMSTVEVSRLGRENINRAIEKEPLVTKIKQKLFGREVPVPPNSGLRSTFFSNRMLPDPHSSGRPTRRGDPLPGPRAKYHGPAR